MRHTTTREEYMTALEKIRSVMESDDQDYLDVIDDSTAVYQPQVSEKNSKQDTWLTECRASLSRSQVVIVSYESISSQETKARELEPIGLYYYSDHWHLIAWCRLREDYRDFRLDRIKTLTLKPEQFKRRDHTSLQEYLKRDAGSELHEIVVTFSCDAAKFVGEQRYPFGIVREREVDEALKNFDVLGTRLGPLGVSTPMTMLGVTRLAIPGLMFELEATAND